jgi:hypothetical protein
MLQEHALRKIEFFVHRHNAEKEAKIILDNILAAANRGYSYGDYMARGHFVIAPVEDFDARLEADSMELLWPFANEAEARRFLILLKSYFDKRGTRADILGLEGYVVR